jgi:ferredoxin
MTDETTSVVVDRDKCQGHLRCVMAAESVFTADEIGHAEVTLDPVPAEMEDAVRRAVTNCPEAALRLVKGSERQ